MTPARKSEWCHVLCRTERHREAIRSWFGFMADDMIGPTEARHLERTDDGRVVKLKALFKGSDGTEKVLIRTFGRQFTITCRPPVSKEFQR